MARQLYLTPTDMNFEITNRCYTGCRDYCYKTGLVGPKEAHVPLGTIKRRMEWTKRHTDATTYWLIGGEPLTHPEFRQICDLVLDQGMNLAVITSGKTVPGEEKNLDYLLTLYRQGDALLNVSYHPGRNDEEFKGIYRTCRTMQPARRDIIQQRIDDLTSGDGDARKIAFLKDRLATAMTTTVTLGRKNASRESFTRAFDFVRFDCLDISRDALTYHGASVSDEGLLDILCAKLADHFQPFAQSRVFSINMANADHEMPYSVRFWGAMEITPQGVFRARATPENDEACSAMRASHDDGLKTASLGSLLVRTDGELVFPTPTCIAAQPLLGNIDELDDDGALFDSVRRAIDWYKDMIIETKASRAATARDRCKMDPEFPAEFKDRSKYVCPSCEFDLSCNICTKVTRADLPRERSGNREYIRTLIPGLEQKAAGTQDLVQIARAS